MAGNFRPNVQGEDVEWHHVFQFFGTFTGKTKWSRLLNVTGGTDDSNWFFRLRNRGSGGKHLRIEKSTDGSTVLQVDDNGLTLSAGTFNHLPVGLVIPYAGSSVPSKYLLCNGQAVSRTTYSALFTAIGTTWGSGDGSTTFNVPDLRGRFPLGVSGSFALGATGGASSINVAHTHGPGTLSLPHRHSHSHGMNNHTHGVSTTVESGDSSGGSDIEDVPDAGGTTFFSKNTHSHEVVISLTSAGPSTNSTETDNSDISSTQTASGTTASGGSSSESTLNPYAALNYVIYAAV